MADWTVPGWLGWTALATLVVLLVLVAAALTWGLRARTQARRDRDLAREQTVALQEQVDRIERRLATAGTVSTPASEYTITRLGEGDDEDRGPDGPAPMLPAPVFTDLVLRESVVQAASLVAGLRRALAPEMRHRIRFEMRREVKRARKQRRADLRTARREWEARQRADLAPDERESDAA